MLSVWGFWVKCFKNAWNRAWKLFSHIRAVGAILGALVALGLVDVLSNNRFSQLIGLPSQFQSIIAKWLVIGPVILFCISLLYYFVCAPRDQHADALSEKGEMEADYKEQLNIKTAECENAKKELATFLNEHQPLELNASVEQSTRRGSVMLHVHNSSEYTIADNVRVYISAIDQSLKLSGKVTLMRPSETESTTLNAGDKLHLTLFNVSYQTVGDLLYAMVDLRGKYYGYQFTVNLRNKTNDNRSYNPFDFNILVTADGRPKVERRFRIQCEMAKAPNVTVAVYPVSEYDVY